MLLGTIFSEITFCEDNQDFSNALVLLSFIFSLGGKMFITASFDGVYAITAELFPTQIRTNALGLCSAASRVANMLTPALLTVYETVSWLPGTLFAAMALLAGVFTLWLPETYGIDTLMTIEEAKIFYEKHS